MKIESFNFKLPEQLIALYPMEHRDHSNLLVVDRDSGTFKAYKFYEIMDFFNSGDVLVLNNSKVISCQLEGKKSTGGKFQFLFLEKINNYSWKALVNKSKRCHLNDLFCFDDSLYGTISNILVDGVRIITFDRELTISQLNDIGKVPLPPYIAKRRDFDLNDKQRYQTVYSKNFGSVAAPTAGLHFTEDLINKIKLKKVFIKYITLHVGLGTFKPITTSYVNEHKMTCEKYLLTDEVTDTINSAKKRKRRIFSVGTTSTRVLEGNYKKETGLMAQEGETGLYIYPGFNFLCVDCLITNFHTPKSTPYILTCAFGGKELIEEAYKYAINKKFRFYSYGDSMLVL